MVNFVTVEQNLEGANHVTMVMPVELGVAARCSRLVPYGDRTGNLSSMKKSTIVVVTYTT